MLFCCFSSFQILKLFTFEQKFSSITSSVQKKTAEEKTKTSDTYKCVKTGKLPSINSFRSSFCNFTPILEITKNTFKSAALLQSTGVDAPNQVLKLTNIMGNKYISTDLKIKPYKIVSWCR